MGFSLPEHKNVHTSKKINKSGLQIYLDKYGKFFCCPGVFFVCFFSSTLTLLCTAAASLLQSVLPVVQLHTEGTTQRCCGLWVGHLHHVNVTVCGAEVAAVERGHLGLGLLEGGPCPVLEYPRKLEQQKKENNSLEININNIFSFNMAGKRFCTVTAITAANATL